MKRIIIPLIFLAALNACSEKEYANDRTSGDIICLVPEIMDMTKAGNDPGSLTSFGLVVSTEASGQLFSGEMVPDGGRWVTASGGLLFWGLDNADTDFFAFVPYSENVSPDAPFQVSVALDQTQSGSVASSDFMTARTVASRDGGDVRLEFAHRFSKINVYVTIDGSPVEKDLLTEVSVDGLKTMAVFDPEDCTVVPDGEPSEIYMYKDSDCFTCMTVPQSMESGDLSLTIVYDGDTFLWTSGEKVLLEPGTEYTLAINAVTTK